MMMKMNNFIQSLNLYVVYYILKKIAKIDQHCLLDHNKGLAKLNVYRIFKNQN